MLTNHSGLADQVASFILLKSGSGKSVGRPIEKPLELLPPKKNPKRVQTSQRTTQEERGRPCLLLPKILFKLLAPSFGQAQDGCACISNTY